MAQIKFRVRGSKSDSPIYIRFSNGRDCVLEMKSGYFCDPKYFDNDAGRVRAVAEFTDKVNLDINLNGLANNIRRSFNSTAEFTKEWLVREIKLHHGLVDDNERPTLTKVIEKYIRYKEYGSEDDVTQSTIATYKTTLSRLIDFESFKDKSYTIDMVGSDFKSEFVIWAKTIKHYQAATYSKTIKQIRSVCKYAKLQLKLNIDDTILLTTKSKTKKKTDTTEVFKPVHLSFQELHRISKFSGSEHLENARNWLLISCWTACRVSDLMKLTKGNLITTIDREKSIKYTQVKTGLTVEVPLLPEVSNVIDRLGDFPRPISHQKYNDYIKTVCELSGITNLVYGGKMSFETKRKEFGKFPKHQLVTSHIGRKSFSTNHYGLISNHSIMQVTGHQTERQFLEYVGERNTNHVTDFHRLHKEMRESGIERAELS